MVNIEAAEEALWEAEGPPHWFKIETRPIPGGLKYEEWIIIDYWRWDGTAADAARFWYMRVDSRETAERIVDVFRDIGLDLHPKAVEYKPDEVLPEADTVSLRAVELA